MELTQGQQYALSAIQQVGSAFPDGGGVVVISGYAGTGKALASDQRVQTPLGPRPIGDLSVGDFVFARNGKSVRVIGVFPQGRRQSYRVTFRDGVSVECDEEHLWTVQTPKLRSKNRWTTLSLKEIVAAGLRFDSGPHKFAVPLCSPVEYPEVDLPVHPYLLGLLLGDGTSLGRTPALCVPMSEKELVDSAARLLPTGMTVNANFAPACPQWRFVDLGSRNNRLAQHFRTMGLALKSPERFVPEIYLRSCPAQRLDLLRGLMDTDGSASGNRIRFSTHSKRLALDVVNLVQSLGGTAIFKADKRGAFNVNVKMLVNPFRLQRKAAIWKRSWKNPPSRSIVSVAPTRVCEHVCIKVDSEDELFLTESFVVTHNTTLLRTLSEEDEHLTVLAPTGKAAMRAAEVAPVNASTIHRWLYDVAEDPQTGKLVTAVRDCVSIPQNRTIFIDEASMVTFQTFKDLYRVARRDKLNLVFIGDGFQLPPVEPLEKYKDFSVLASDSPAHFRVEMTEVVRQAQDNPIIRASMEIRDLRSDMGALTSLPVIPPTRLVPEGAKVVSNGGGLICHKNATRHALNNDIRRELGITQQAIQKGEPLMVIQNNYELDVYNGETVTVLDQPVVLGDKNFIVTDRFANESMNFWFYRTRIDTPIGPRWCLFGDREVFGESGKIGCKFIRRTGQEASRKLKLNDLRAEGHSLSYQELDELRGDPVVNANLGYCLTAHKAQGSEFPHTVVAIEDSIRLHSQDGRRWLYTALTRSKASVKICWL